MHKNKIQLLVALIASLSIALVSCGNPYDDMKSDTDDTLPKDDYGEPGKEYADTSDGFSAIELEDGSFVYESVAITPELEFDKARSLKAFSETLYPFVRTNMPEQNIAGTPRPLYADDNIEIAHEYALTQVNFNDLASSKIITNVEVYREHCIWSCEKTAKEILRRLIDWKKHIANMLYQQPRSLEEDVVVTNQMISKRIAEDRALLSADDERYVVYATFHQHHNYNFNAHELNVARVALSKALNATARWAPDIVNPVDVNGDGILYRFDVRDYWGWSKGIDNLLFGGSDNDMAFANGKTDYQGNLVDISTQGSRYPFAGEITQDPELALTIWQRVLHGNVEEPNNNGIPPARIEGFRGPVRENAAGQYIRADELEWVDAGQLVYTLTRGSVYASIMMLPMFADQLEEELDVDSSEGMDSYDYFVTFDANPIDAQFAFKGNRPNGGFYWKTFEVMTGTMTGEERNIYDIYSEGGDDIRFPFWANPIPLFLNPADNPMALSSSSAVPQNWSFVATLAQNDPFGSDPLTNDCQSPSGGDFSMCKHYNGQGGRQQSESTIIWDLPNGLNGFMRAGTFNQRRIEASFNIIRDLRLYRLLDDRIAHTTGFYLESNTLPDSHELYMNSASSYFALYPDGLEPVSNDLRDWLDNDVDRLPKGSYGVDGWVSDESTVERVRELYPTTEESKPFFTQARRDFLLAMRKIQQGMIVGKDKNIYVEPISWMESVWRQKGQAIIDWSQTLSPDSYYFPDPDLAHCIQNFGNLGLEKLTSLQCHNVKDLTGLENLTNLDRLVLTGEVGQIDLGKLPNIASLTLNGSDVPSLTIGDASNLTHLHIRESNIDSIDVDSETLTELFIFSNAENISGQIQAENLQALSLDQKPDNLAIGPTPKLELLNVAYDQLDLADIALQLSELPALHTLSLSAKELIGTSLDLRGSPQISDLSINFPMDLVQLAPEHPLRKLLLSDFETETDLAMDGYTYLENISIQNVTAGELNLEGLTGLQSVEIGNSEFSSVKLDGLSYLKNFSANDSNLPTVKIHDSPELLGLSLQGSTIETVDVENNELAFLALDEIAGLKHVRIVNSNITLAEFTAPITHIELSDNSELEKITVTDDKLEFDLNKLALQNLPKLNNLSLFLGESTGELDLTAFPQLKEFFYGGFSLNQVKTAPDNQTQRLLVEYSFEDSLDTSLFPNLVDLDIWGQAKAIDLSNNPLLEELLISSPPLESIDFSNNTQLRDLEIRKTQMTELDLYSNTKLERVNLGNNDLQSLLLPHHPNLESIRLMQGQLSCDTTDKLRNFTGVETYISLSNCPL